MTATYSLQDNALTEQPEMQRPNELNYAATSRLYKHDLDAYNAHLATLRTIPCHESARSLWKDGRKVVEGKDYEVQWDYTKGTGKDEIAFPLPVKSDDDLWKEVLTKIHMKALAYVSVGGHPHPGLTNHDPWHKEMINKLKSEYIITKR